MGNCFSSQKQELDKDKVEHVEDSIPINPPQQQTPPGKLQIKKIHPTTTHTIYIVKMSVYCLTMLSNRNRW